jgi:hypothetical protein
MSELLGISAYALIPMTIFLIIYFASKWRPALFTSVIWFCYVLYELGMKYGPLCSGDCSIRPDIIILVPLLIAGSVGVAIWSVVAIARRVDKSKG